LATRGGQDRGALGGPVEDVLDRLLGTRLASTQILNYASRVESAADALIAGCHISRHTALFPRRATSGSRFHESTDIHMPTPRSRPERLTRRIDPRIVPHRAHLPRSETFDLRVS
jgi:hypothetical protein